MDKRNAAEKREQIYIYIYLVCFVGLGVFYNGSVRHGTTTTPAGANASSMFC